MGIGLLPWEDLPPIILGIILTILGGILLMAAAPLSWRQLEAIIILFIGFINTVYGFIKINREANIKNIIEVIFGNIFNKDETSKLADTIMQNSTISEIIILQKINLSQMPIVLTFPQWQVIDKIMNHFGAIDDSLANKANNEYKKALKNQVIRVSYPPQN